MTGDKRLWPPGDYRPMMCLRPHRDEDFCSRPGLLARAPAQFMARHHPLRLSLRPDDLRVLISPIWPAALEYAPAQSTRIVWAAEVVTAAEVPAVVTTIRAAKRPKVTAEAV